MLAADSSLVVLALVVLQVLGVASSLLARMSLGYPGHALFQGLFLFMFGLLGLATMAAVYASATLWLPCGFTLPAMVLAVVWDFRRDRLADVPR